jgi:hypothetical protein
VTSGDDDGEGDPGTQPSDADPGSGDHDEGA